MAEIGKPIDRVDAFLKVTGAAKYAAEFNQPNMAYGFPVRATIGKGTIASFDTAAAQSSKGILKILTHENAPRLKALDQQAMQQTGGMLGEQLAAIQDNKVNYFGQYIALVIAETYEQARAAAELVKVSYDKETPAIDLKKELPNGKRPEKLMGDDAQLNDGKTAAILNAAPVKVEHTYTTPNENHHPMEPHATIAIWEGPEKLKIYDASQGVVGARGMMSYLFDLKPENVQVISPYVGGGFGCKGSQWGHIMLAIMAAKVVNRPVKIAITRQMMQTNVGRRAETQQTVALSTGQDGNLSAIRHHTDTYGNLSGFFEPSGKQTAVLYAAPVREITYQVTKLNIGTPTFMRAPGETPGTFALESAMDELAYELKMDPIQLRILNHTAIDPVEKHPFSSEYLKECYQLGADKFGWSKRNAQPRQSRNGNYLVGYGMATATYPGIRSASSVKMQMKEDGSVTVSSATQDIGTGTYTIMTQTAADALGIPLNKITAKLGDSNFPSSPVSGGSTTAASVTPAVLAAGEMMKKDFINLATADAKSKLKGRNAAEIDAKEGKLFLKDDPSKVDSYVDIMRRNKKKVMEVCTTSMPASGSGLGSPKVPCNIAPMQEDENSDSKKYAFHSFGAQFAEVWVDEDLGTIKVKRFVSVQDAGRILNEKTGRSQIIGGVIYGLGAALMEETQYDKRWANPATRTLADYHVPVNLDVPPIDVYFIGKPDPHISKIGARGIGEIGITGVAAAVANAVFNATGKRLRDLPLTPDKLLA
jgi:xanthine dehydrogenase YagR molybdenum-binding subunit